MSTTRKLVLVLVVFTLVAELGAQAPNLPSVMVWVDREDMSRGNALQTELTINGKLVDIFSAETQKAIDRHLQKGWNTITLKTTPKADALQTNQLLLNVGVARAGAKNHLEMDPTLWEFRNGAGWELRETASSSAPSIRTRRKSRRPFRSTMPVSATNPPDFRSKMATTC